MALLIGRMMINQRIRVPDFQTKPISKDGAKLAIKQTLVMKFKRISCPHGGLMIAQVINHIAMDR